MQKRPGPVMGRECPSSGISRPVKKGNLGDAQGRWLILVMGSGKGAGGGREGWHLQWGYLRKAGHQKGHVPTEPSTHLPHPSSYEGIEQGEKNGEERVEQNRS